VRILITKQHGRGNYKTQKWVAAEDVSFLLCNIQAKCPEITHTADRIIEEALKELKEDD